MMEGRGRGGVEEGRGEMEMMEGRGGDDGGRGEALTRLGVMVLRLFSALST